MNHFTTPKGTVLPFLNLKGKDYLQVAHRLVWFREEKPNWGIDTRVHVLDDALAVVEATILDEAGNLKARGFKMQGAKGFAQYLEKAESGAIGRALAFLGYGTQHAQELEEDDDTPMGQLSDSPMASRPIGAGARAPIPAAPKSGAPENKAAPSKTSLSPETISEAQAKRLFAIASTAGFSNDQIKDQLSTFGYQSSRDIRKSDYDNVVNSFSDKKGTNTHGQIPH
jgi:hypothetical protein